MTAPRSRSTSSRGRRHAHRPGGNRGGLPAAHRKSHGPGQGPDGKTAAKMAVLVKAPERIQRVCADIARALPGEGRPERLRGAGGHLRPRELRPLQAGTRRATCRRKSRDIVMTVATVASDRVARAFRRRDAEEKLLDRFRDPADPLKILIVTSKLLTGFDAPILQAMYLDKPLRDHTLLQAICRTNRPYGEEKTHGLIVDYLGIFDDVAQALEFDEKGIRRWSRTSTS